MIEGLTHPDQSKRLVASKALKDPWFERMEGPNLCTRNLVEFEPEEEEKKKRKKK